MKFIIKHPLALLFCAATVDVVKGTKEKNLGRSNDNFALHVLRGGKVSAAGTSHGVRELTPLNDPCSGAVGIVPGSNVIGSTALATFDDVGICGTSNTAPGVWYQVTGNGNTFIASTCGAANYDTKISVFSGTCSGLTCVGGNDDACPSFRSQVGWLSQPGTDYFILVHGYSSGTGDFTLTLSDVPPPPPPANDDVCDADDIILGSSVTGSTTSATFDDVGICGTSNTAPGVWYQVSGNGNTFIASTCGAATYDTKISVFSGTCGGLACVGGNDDACPLFRSQVNWVSQPGTDYFILVHGFSSGTGDFTLTLSEVVPPANDDVCDAEPMVVQSPEAYNNQFAGVEAGEINPGPGTGPGGSCNSQDGWCSFETDIDNSIWFQFVPLVDGCIDIFTDNSDNLQLALWQVGDCSDFTTFSEVAANDDSLPVFAPRIINAKIFGGISYYIQLDGFAGTVSQGNIIIGEILDTTPPAAECSIGVNPAGEETGSKNSGFFKIVGDDDCSEVDLYVKDNGSDTVFGPYPSGTFIKYVIAPGAPTSEREMNGDVDYMIKGNGEPKVYAVDGSGNVSGEVDCSY